MNSQASSISNYLQLDVDAHVYVAYQNNQPGIAGIAWVGTTCNVYQYYRTSISEWITSDANCARVKRYFLIIYLLITLYLIIWLNKN